MIIDYSKLIEEARKAIDKGFYAANTPNRRYGAAVMTDKGNIYSAGQYSSFNHITSIHAEMGAIISATMNNDSGVVALALASSCKEATCSCGVCMQFIKEHCMRTGIDIELIYDGESEIHFMQSELTDKIW